jgi:hypothetical protein
MVSDFELLQADSLLERARFSVLSAQAAARMKFLGAANSAGYLQKVIQVFEDGGAK